MCNLSKHLDKLILEFDKLVFPVFEVTMFKVVYEL